MHGQAKGRRPMAEHPSYPPPPPASLPLFTAGTVSGTTGTSNIMNMAWFDDTTAVSVSQGLIMVSQIGYQPAGAPSRLALGGERPPHRLGGTPTPLAHCLHPPQSPRREPRTRV